jgi:hypothetical protein
MFLLTLTLRNERTESRLDPDAVVGLLSATFPGTRVIPGDSFADGIGRLRNLGCDDGPPLVSLRNLQQRAGPGRRFEIQFDDSSAALGVARKDLVQFRFAERPSDATVQRLTNFLSSLGIGEIESSDDPP